MTQTPVKSERMQCTKVLWSVAAVLITLALTQTLLAQKTQPRLQQAGNWRDITVKLLTTENSGGPGQMREVPAKLTAFEIRGARGYTVVVLHDPRTNKTYVLPRLLDTNAGSQGFYFSNTDGVFAVAITLGGDLAWTRSLSEIAQTTFDWEAAGARFATEWEEPKLLQRLTQSPSIGLASALNPDFFLEPTSSFPFVQPQIVGASTTLDGLLRLDLMNTKRQRPASIWVDFRVNRVVRSVDENGMERTNIASRKLWVEKKARLITERTPAGPPLATPQSEDVLAPIAVFSPLGLGSEWTIAAIADPNSRKVHFFEGEADFYISTRSGMLGVWNFNDILVRRQFAEIARELVPAEEQFAADFDADRIETTMREGFRVNLNNILGFMFFARGSQAIPAELRQIDLADGILHLELRSPSTMETANVWMDIRPTKLFSQRLTRVELEGKLLPIPPVWIEGKAKIVSTASDSQVESVDARYASLQAYERTASVAVIRDARSGTVSIVNGYYNYVYAQRGVRENNGNEYFYVARPEGAIGFIIGYGGTVEISPAYFAMTSPAAGIEKVLSAFESELDRKKLDQWLGPLQHAVQGSEIFGAEFFQDPTTKKPVRPEIGKIEIQGDILNLTLIHSTTRRAALITFNLKTYTAERAYLDGKEIEIKAAAKQQ